MTASTQGAARALAALATLACLPWLVSCSSMTAEPPIDHGTLIRNVTVVDTRDGTLRAGRSVLIEGRRIARIIDSPAVAVTGSAQVVDGTGKFLIPGLLDMHTHALASTADLPAQWALLIANGITGIRQMAGSQELIQLGRQVNQEREAGRVDAPEVLQVAGDLLAGIPTAPAAVAFVRRQKAIGADMVKIVAANAEVTRAALAEARAQGIPVAGHLSGAVGAIESSALGWRAIEHFGAGTGVLLDCARDEAAIRSALLNGEGAKPTPFGPAAVILPMLDRELDAPFYQRILNSHDDAKCQGIARQMAANGTWQVPTLIRLKTMMLAADPAFRQDTNLRYVEPKRVALWQGLSQRFSATMPPPAALTFANYYAAVQRMTRMFKAQGTKMLTGSDTGGIWVVPGFGLHQEFRELAAAGLSPLEVLQMSTLHGAEFLGRQASMGTVDEGKNADLVLLDANPLSSVDNLARIAAVVVAGKVFAKDRLEAMKAEVAAGYAAAR